MGLGSGGGTYRRYFPDVRVVHDPSKDGTACDEQVASDEWEGWSDIA